MQLTPPLQDDPGAAPPGVVRPLQRPLNRPLRLGVLVSGGGTTLQNFIDQIAAGTLHAEIPLVMASREECGGILRAERAGIPCAVLPRGRFGSVEEFSEAVFAPLREAEVDVAALAGFLELLRIPQDFTLRVMNIHPALIPAFCGKGYYGRRVHEAVLDRGVKVSGCTVHFADNHYDHGPIILQTCVPVHDDDTPETLAARVFEAECRAYPEALRLFAAARLELCGPRVRILPAS